MRSKYRVAVAVLVASLAVTALAASSAFASLPEFKQVKPGETFSGKVGSPTWELSNSWTWNDTEATISGEFVTEGTHAYKALQNVKLTFTGGNHTASCNNGAPWELTLTGLEAYLGYLNESTKLIGLVFFKPGGEWFAMKLEPVLTKCTNPINGAGNFEGILAVPLTNPHGLSQKHGLSFEMGEAKGTMRYNMSTFRWEGGKSPDFTVSYSPKLAYKNGVQYGVGIKAEIPFETSNFIEVEG